MDKLTISIVNFNSGNYLYECLQSIKKIQREVDFEVAVVDNASSDESFIKAKKVKLNVSFIKNETNLGFSKAHNLVLKNLNSEYVLLLNPDTRLERGVLTKLLKVMGGDSTIGAASCKIVHDNGQIDWASHRGFPTPLVSLLYFFGSDLLYHMSFKKMDSPHEVDAISGAFFLTRKSVLEKVGLFDEQFFMYAEDIDLCLRIKQAGYKVMYFPEVKIVHHKGVSTGVKKHSQGLTTAGIDTKLRSLNSFYETMELFYKKHYEKKYPFFINWLIYSGINIKWFLAKRKLLV